VAEYFEKTEFTSVEHCSINLILAVSRNLATVSCFCHWQRSKKSVTLSYSQYY